jgi:hypothetical protein
MPHESLAILDAGPFDRVDPDEFVRAAMRWHFDPATGSRYWLDRAERLDFDPRHDVKGVADLVLFPAWRTNCGGCGWRISSLGATDPGPGC